jgi:hypothetical protein
VTLSDAELARECAAFARYLADAAATPAMQAYYVRAHATIPHRGSGLQAPVDRWLSGAAGRGGLPLRLADAYARFFRPTGPLRQKLTLMLAILENSPETHERLNTSETGRRGAVLAGLALTGLTFAATLAFATLVFGPRQLLGGGTAATDGPDA